jgi:hypothetical protein
MGPIENRSRTQIYVGGRDIMTPISEAPDRVADAVLGARCFLLDGENSPSDTKSTPPLQAAIDDLQRDFETDESFLLTAIGWRHAAHLLIRAAEDLDLRDYAGAEHNRQQARQRFIDGNTAFKRLPAASEAIALLGGGAQ